MEEQNSISEPVSSEKMAVDGTYDDTNENEDDDLVINEKTGLLEKRVSLDPIQPTKRHKTDHIYTASLDVEESTGSISPKATGDQSVLKGDSELELDMTCTNVTDKGEKTPGKGRGPGKRKVKEKKVVEEKPAKVGKSVKGRKAKKKSAPLTPKQKYQQVIQTAFDAVAAGKMTIREACKEYNIPDSTLRDRLKSQNIKKLKKGSAGTFNQLQADKLADFYCLLCKLGYNYASENLCTLASQYAVSLDKRTHSRPITKHWYYMFSDGYPKVKEHRLQLQQMERTGSNTAEAFTPTFLSYLSKTMQKHDLTNKPENIYSFTSTELSYLPPYIVRKVPLIKEPINLFICANAAGEVMPPYYVFPEASTEIDGLAEDCKPGKAVLVEEKLFPSEILLNFLKTHFQEFSSKDEHRIILVDGHNMYASLDVVEWGEDHNLSVVVIPSPCTEKRQPLELECREAFEKLSIEYCEAHEDSELERKVLCQALSVAYSNVFTAYDIKNSFRETEIFTNY